MEMIRGKSPMERFSSERAKTNLQSPTAKRSTLRFFGFLFFWAFATLIGRKVPTRSALIAEGSTPRGCFCFFEHKMFLFFLWVHLHFSFGERLLWGFSPPFFGDFDDHPILFFFFGS